MIVDKDIYLSHYGVKGMQWGVRKQASNSNKRVDKMARKDAEEAARAKMYYGKGAGTRRKLINKTVEARKKNDPAYAKAFDDYYAKQDLSVHATKAVKERKRTDRKDSAKKSTGYIARKLTGEMGTKAAFTAVALAGAAYLASPKARQKTKQIYDNVKTSAQAKKGAYMISRYLKTQKL